MVVCLCFWVFHKHRWECKVLMELNILILISTENPQYFKYISDKNTSHHILKSSNGQTKEFVLKTFQLDCFRKSFVLVLFLGRLWSISNSFERHHSLSGIGNPNFECFCWLFFCWALIQLELLLFSFYICLWWNLFFSPRVFWLHKPW